MDVALDVPDGRIQIAGPQPPFGAAIERMQAGRLLRHHHEWIEVDGLHRRSKQDEATRRGRLDQEAFTDVRKAVAGERQEVGEDKLAGAARRQQRSGHAPRHAHADAGARRQAGLQATEQMVEKVTKPDGDYKKS